MNDPRPLPGAQPGMTAWGRAAERELEAYLRSTALRAPDELTERVMGAIAGATPAGVRDRGRWLPIPTFTRLRTAGGLAAVLFTLAVGGVLAFAGATALTRHDAPPPVHVQDDQPIVIVQPTPTFQDDIAEPTPEPRDAVEAPKAPKPDRPDAVEAPGRPAEDEATEPGGGGEDADETDEPDATDDNGGDGNGPDSDAPTEVDEPDDGGSSAGSGGG